MAKSLLTVYIYMHVYRLREFSYGYRPLLTFRGILIHVISFVCLGVIYVVALE